MKHLFRRFLSYYIDGICILLLSIVFYMLHQKLILKIDLMEIENISSSSLTTTYLTTAFAYFFLLELLFNRTIGKYFLQLKVVCLEKQLLKNKIVTIFIRTISRLIPFEPFSIFFNTEKMMWHDLLSKTTVVQIKKN